MRSFIDKRIAEILSEHDIEIRSDDKGRVITINQNPFGAREIERWKSYFSAACHFAPILLDERLTRIVAA